MFERPRRVNVLNLRILDLKFWGRLERRKGNTNDSRPMRFNTKRDFCLSLKDESVSKVFCAQKLFNATSKSFHDLIEPVLLEKSNPAISQMQAPASHSSIFTEKSNGDR